MHFWLMQITLQGNNGETTSTATSYWDALLGVKHAHHPPDGSWISGIEAQASYYQNQKELYCFHTQGIYLGIETSSAHI